MTIEAPPTARARTRRLWGRLLGAWIAFWILMFLLGTQEYLWSGGRRLLPPFIDFGTAAFLSTAIAAMQVRRARRIDGLLRTPLRWFMRLWAWLPLEALGFVATMYALRDVFYRLAGMTYQHGAWGPLIAYEVAKFVLFYMLFGGIHFGLRSYRVWVADRLRAEQQARLAQEAQLAQLTQQLQPHFLFNALNTVSSLIHSDPDMADTLLTRLATLLRAATDASRRPQQPLVDELALLHAYADIMTQRFADRVQIDWAIDDGVQRCLVPTLGLQPLLENCFAHVVERRRGLTRIAVHARRDADRLCIEIEDDGDLHAAAPPVPGVGLGNLERRLRSLHGERGRLTLTARPGGGTTVRVELPCGS